ncbi:MAG: PorT family protein [Chitinophagaceae bacterium]|jgi:hypothetical protein|nr:PorT family protein [Chitinophagaceae bacterium]OQY94282.1 MAG: hypothetical protein B6D37_08495 [Sphingobacteriales bacterium UTBCD1]
MRKIIFYIQFSLFFLGAAHAQFGVNGGLNISNMRGSEIQNNKSKAGLHIGMFYQVPLSGNFSLQPEVAYSGEGTKISYNGGVQKYNLNFMNLSLLFRYNFEGDFNLATGLQYGALLSAKLKTGSNSTDLKNLIRNANYSWVITAGYELPSGFGFYGRYNLGISDIEKDSQRGSLKASTFQLGVRYTINPVREE